MYSDAVEIRKKEYPGCLWGIWEGRIDMVLSHCDLATPPSHAQSWPTTGTRHLVYHPKGQPMTVQCRDGQKATEFFEGLRSVDVAPGCFAENRELELQTPSTIYSGHVQVQGPQIRLHRMNLSSSKREGPAQARAALRTWGEPQKILHVAGGERSSLGNLVPSWYVVAGSSLTGILLATWCLLGIWCWRTWTCHGPRRRRSEEPRTPLITRRKAVKAARPDTRRTASEGEAEIEAEEQPQTRKEGVQFKNRAFQK